MNMIAGLSNTWPKELYDVADASVGILKGLLSLFLFQLHQRYPAKWKSVFYILAFIYIQKFTN
jgi:hypothetical protein